MAFFSYRSALLLALFSTGSLFVEAAGAQQTGACEAARAENYLYINNVRARIFNNGALFWNGAPWVYEVPKGEGVQAFFAASIWVGGLVNQQLRVAGARYGLHEFWPGPLTDDGALPNPDDCTAFDRVYKISRADVLLFEQTGEATADLRDWPWRLGAPVIDGDGIADNYDLEAGDRPQVLGHQTLWWVMNDLGNVHEQTETPPLGLEVQVTAFATVSDIDAINNATLYKYKLINRGPDPVEKTYFGIWSDPDLGDFADDFIGSDTTLGLAFVYNADNEDEGHYGYGAAPPAAGFTFPQGPLVNDDGLDNNRDGAIDEADERLGMTSFLFYNGGGCVICDPVSGEDYYNYMQALWKDGRPVTVGGNGRDFSDTPTKFMYPGDPVTGAFWSERNADGRGQPIDHGDRRFVTATGPFTLRPGEAQEIVVAVVWARGADHLDSINALRDATQTVQDAYAVGLDTAIPLRAAPPAPSPTAPGDRAAGQPVTPTLHWDAIETAAGYLVDVATDVAFTSVVGQYVVPVGASLMLDTLALNQTYYWRVRAENEAGYSPFSTVREFSTAGVVIREPGLLFLSDDSEAYVEIAGPGGLDPCGPEARNTFGCDEVGGNLVQMSFNSDSSYVMKVFSYYHRYYAPNDYEIRFKEEGSFAWYTEQSEIGKAPFEVWDIGPTGPFGENDPVDDVQLIARLRAEGDEFASVFQYGHGWPGDPFNLGWPSTEAITVLYPRDGKTYQDFADFAASGPIPRPIDTELLANTLVNTRRRPLRSVMFFGNATRPSFRLQGPAEGTVIRFYTTAFGLAPSTHAAPEDGAGRQPETLTLWWHRSPSGRHDHLQVSTQPDFSTLIVDHDSLETTHYTVSGLDAAATYYWRIRTSNREGTMSAWSRPWRFTVGDGPIIPATSLPPDYTLLQNYPNPFNPTTTIWFGLPEPSDVRLSVYNVLGQRVATLVEAVLPTGWHTARWDAYGLSSGLYIYRLETNARVVAKPMMLVR